MGNYQFFLMFSLCNSFLFYNVIAISIRRYIQGCQKVRDRFFELSNKNKQNLIPKFERIGSNRAINQIRNTKN